MRKESNYVKEESKKILAAALGVGMAVSMLAACGEDAGESSGTHSGESSVEQSQEDIQSDLGMPSASSTAAMPVQFWAVSLILSLSWKPTRMWRISRMPSVLSHLSRPQTERSMYLPIRLTGLKHIGKGKGYLTPHPSRAEICCVICLI